MILLRHSHLSGLIIQQAHLQTLHGGTQLTLGTVRQRYWMVGCKAPVRSLILKCVVCARHRGIRAQQLMGQLPISRVSPTRAFLNSGVDYAGPVALKSWKGRGHKSYKGWLAVFVCMVTSAMHLEIVSNPHFGGKWEAAVKSVKFLTPGHFLIGGPLNALPEPDLTDVTVSRLTRWQLIQQKVQSFWRHWSRSYIQHLQTIAKWRHANWSIGVGSLVLLADDRFPASKWPLARVVALHPGSDGLTRVVTLKTALGSLSRPVSKLLPLPVAACDVEK